MYAKKFYFSDPLEIIISGLNYILNNLKFKLKVAFDHIFFNLNDVHRYSISKLNKIFILNIK